MLRTSIRHLTAAALLAVAVPDAWAQHTTFTYQGNLLHQGAPYTGTADFQFRLHTAETGGSLTSFPVERYNVAVEDGLFLAELDFGSDDLAGERWLSIAVRTPAWDGQGPEPPLTVLPGRHRVAASPYAVHTRGIFVNEAGNRVGIGTTSPQTALHVAGKVRADDGVQFRGGTLNDVITKSTVLDFNAFAGTVAIDVVVPGLADGDAFLYAFESFPPQLALVSARIVNGNDIRFEFQNIVGFPVNPPPFGVNIIAFKQ